MIDLRAVAAYLSGHVGTASGITYAGGLTKFEPKELERVGVPPLEKLHDLAHQMELFTAARGRREREKVALEGAAG